MKTLAVFSILLFALTMSCGDSGEVSSTPADAVTEMFDALKAGNGERAVSYMSESALEEMDAQLEMIKLDPEASAMQLAAVGIEINAADIPDMTAEDFAISMFSSPMITSIMGSAEVNVGEVTIEGDIAKVEVTTTFMDDSETNIIDVVKENGQWKVTEFGFNM